MILGAQYTAATTGAKKKMIFGFLRLAYSGQLAARLLGAHVRILAKAAGCLPKWLCTSPQPYTSCLPSQVSVAASVAEL